MTSAAILAPPKGPPRSIRARHARLPWRARVLTAALFFMCALCWSPLLPQVLHINSSAAFLTAFVVVYALAGQRHALAWEVAAGAALTACVLMLTLTQSMTLLARIAPIPFLILAARYATLHRSTPVTLCHWLTLFFGAGVVLSWIGFVYAYLGGEPLLTIQNTDGRDNVLYLTTFTNFWVGNVIRPAFIYDEPGAFSFMLCTTVGLRELLRQPRGPSIFLMLAGLITISLMHMVILTLFLLLRLGPARSTVLVAVLGALAFGVLRDSNEFEFLTARFEVVDGKLGGDNRSEQIDNLNQVIDTRMFFFGDVICHDRPNRICEDHGDISSSPATPVYRGGLLLLVAQLAVHLLLIIACARRRFWFSAMTLFLLFLQRPYFEGYGYGMMLYIQLFLMFGVSSRGQRLEPASHPQES